MLMDVIQQFVKKHPQVRFPAKSQCSGQHTCSVNKRWRILFLPSILVEVFRGSLQPQQQNSDILCRSICIASFKKETSLNTLHYRMLPVKIRIDDGLTLCHGQSFLFQIQTLLLFRRIDATYLLPPCCNSLRSLQQENRAECTRINNTTKETWKYRSALALEL